MTCAKKVDTMLLRKLLYLIVLLQVTGARVLYIMIKCKDKLSRILDLGSTCGHEFHGHRPGIIMCEASVRLNLDVVTASEDRPYSVEESVPSAFVASSPSSQARCWAALAPGGSYERRKQLLRHSETRADCIGNA